MTIRSWTAKSWYLPRSVPECTERVGISILTEYAESLSRTRKQRPGLLDKAAFLFGDASLTYAQINAAANQVANGLRSAGLAPGERVAITCPNFPYFPIIFFGILKAGAVVVPLSVLLKQDEIAYHLADSGAKAYFCFIGTDELPMGKMGHAAFRETAGCESFYLIMPKSDMASPIDGAGVRRIRFRTISQFRRVSDRAEDTALIIYTSGTTGKPKAAELTHSNLFLNAMVCSDFLETSPKDTQLIVLPLFHAFALTVLMLAGMYRATTNVLVARFESGAVLDAMRHHTVTLFAGVPTMYWGLLNFADADFDYASISKNLRIAVSGGPSLPWKISKRVSVSTSHRGLWYLRGFARRHIQSEISRPQAWLSRHACFRGVDVKIVDPDGNRNADRQRGELLYRGHNVMKGYHNRPEATAETIREGWLYSGDIAYKDEDGFFFIVDRTKDLIIRGGMNVYPREVEETLIKHEAVSLVAVIGIPDEQMGEEIKAVVVLKEEITITEMELIEWTKERIAAYKFPRQVEFLNALPMTLRVRS